MNPVLVIVSSNEEIYVPLWHALKRLQLQAEVVPLGHSTRQQLSERPMGPNRVRGVIVDAENGDRTTTELIRGLRKASPGMLILAALATPNVHATQAVTEAGAWDYLIHPFDREQMEECFQNWPAALNSTSQPGRLVCFLPARGGDGASTVALHAAAGLSRQRRTLGLPGKVLLLDFDFQSGDIAFRLQLTAGKTVAEATGQADPFDLAWEELACCWNGLDVLASPPQGARIDANQMRRIPALVESARQNYPFVIADMPPALYSSSRELLGAADEIYLVCAPDIASLHFARRRAEELRGLGVREASLRLLLNRAGSHAWIGAREVQQVVGLPVSATLENAYAAVNNAVLKGSLVEPRSTLGRQMEQLSSRILGVSKLARAAAAG